MSRHLESILKKASRIILRKESCLFQQQIVRMSLLRQDLASIPRRYRPLLVRVFRFLSEKMALRASKKKEQQCLVLNSIIKLRRVPLFSGILSVRGYPIQALTVTIGRVGQLMQAGRLVTFSPSRVSTVEMITSSLRGILFSHPVVCVLIMLAQHMPRRTQLINAN